MVKPSRLPRLKTLEGIDVQPDDRVRALLGDLFDVDSALGREHEERLLRAAVERQGEVVLARDVRRPLDPELGDGVAADVHAEDRLGVRLRLRRVLGDLDAARLSAAADLDLRLDHAGVADRLGGLDRLLDAGGRLALGHGNVVPREQQLALVFQKVHRGAADPSRSALEGVPRA